MREWRRYDQSSKHCTMQSKDCMVNSLISPVILEPFKYGLLEPKTATISCHMIFSLLYFRWYDIFPDDNIPFLFFPFSIYVIMIFFHLGITIKMYFHISDMFSHFHVRWYFPIFFLCDIFSHFKLGIIIFSHFYVKRHVLPISMWEDNIFFHFHFVILYFPTKVMIMETTNVTRGNLDQRNVSSRTIIR